MKIQRLDRSARELAAGCHDDGEGGKSESNRMSLRMPGACDTFLAGERMQINDKERIKLVKIAGRLRSVEQDATQLKSDTSEVKGDVSDMKRDIADMKRDIAYMKGKIDVIVDLLSSVGNP